MRNGGSVTVFLALTMSLMVALIGSCLISAQMAAARVQIGCGAQIGLYSLFSQYDKTLLEEFHLFYIDGTFGKNRLDLASCYDVAVDYMQPVLEENYQQLTLTGGGITGYHLATDDGGDSFRDQIVSYMKATLGAQGVSTLINEVKEGSKNVDNQRKAMEESQQGNSYEDYDKVLQEAQSNQQGEGAGDIVEGPVPQVENPIDIVRQIQQMGLLELVLPEGAAISEKTVNTESLVSNRNRNAGMGDLYEGSTYDPVADKILFQEYLLDYTGNYRNPSEGQLSYAMEYVIGKKDSDMENLRSVVNRLMAIREGVNFACIMADGQLRSQAQVMAAAISSALLTPMATSLVEIVLIGCWAFGESLLDVRHLLDGGKTALYKTFQNWQLSLSNLADLLSRRDTDRRDGQGGMDYKDYLRVLLFLESSDHQTWKLMDIFEMTVRNKEGYRNFQMDSCIDAIEMEFDVEANARKTYQARRGYSYY